MTSSGCGSMTSSGSASISGFCAAAAAVLSAILLSNAAFWLTSSSIRLSIAASLFLVNRLLHCLKSLSNLLKPCGNLL